jgi:type I restriction enzyme S subunit
MLTEAPSLLEELKETKVQYFTVSSRWLHKDEFRLDVSFYANEAFAARRLIEESGYEFKSLGQLTSEIFNLSRFKRIYTSDPKQGWPYLSASDVLLFRPQAELWLARSQAPRHAQRHFVKEGWILVSCSGSVGRCVLATRRLEPYFLTHDLIRIVPQILNGYLYAFLSSWLGQALLQKDQYGSTVQHLEPHHVKAVPIPLLPEEQQRWIHERVIEAYKLRDEANDLLDKAEELLYSELGLPRFDESQVPYLGGSKPKAFTLRASELEGRFDASFHVPIAKAAIEQMKQGKYPLVCLSDLAKRIFIPPRFKRIYVAPEYGLPFLQPSHISQLRPFDLKFISKRLHEQEISLCTIQEGWILVTRSGTIGRATYVPKVLEGWVASDDLIRIVPDPAKTNSGFIYTFLNTAYGQHQIAAPIYGGVIDHLEEHHLADILMPNAPLVVQEKIGAFVIEAFEKKEQANAIEDQAIRQLEETLKLGRHYEAKN